jgi:PAS domain S-box-containing protein
MMVESQPDEVAPPPPSRLSPGRSAEDRFAAVVEASPTPLVLTSPGGLIEMMNRQAERIFGYRGQELRGAKLERLFPERLRARLADLRREVPTDVALPMMDDWPDLFGLRKDGTEFPLEIGLGSIQFDGETMLLAGIVDVTEQAAVERERERYRLELERSNAELEEFAYAASHDLKAPLRAISHLVQWVSEDLAPTASPETRENLRLLRSRAMRLQLLLDGLLAYSRVGRTEAVAEEVDIGEVVRDVIAMLSPPPGFVVACEGTMPVIRTDRMSIRVVLENLIGNGLKHHDRFEGRITLSARQTVGVTEFRVTDDGPGIDPRFHDRIFVIFQTLASRDDVESSGIGLAIVKKKVLAHGGRIWVESAPPARGTTFAFTWRASA